MSITFSTDSKEVRTLDNHRKAVEGFVALLLADDEVLRRRDEIESTYKYLLEELTYAEDEAYDLDGSNKDLGILYGFRPYEVERLHEELVVAWDTRFGG